MGEARFATLLGQLPATCTVLGIDEQTACVLDFAAEIGLVLGSGTATIKRGERVEICGSGDTFALSLLRGGS